ncbi:MAG: hypothetical protein DWQ02_13265 [Bacteroidetes bacterium]|nr:MAG: hypothetical protein DWQ02_13265 [Bacteroidota bacterium]
MKKVILFVLTFALTGCSYIVDFYIFNSTENPVTIEYKVFQRSDYEVFTTNPKTVNFRSTKKVSSQKDSLGFKFSEQTNTISCEIAPQQALWLGSDINFSIDNEYGANMLKEKFEYIKVTHSEGEILVTPENLLDHFQTYKLQIVGMKVK